MKCFQNIHIVSCHRIFIQNTKKRNMLKKKEQYLCPVNNYNNSNIITTMRTTYKNQ